MNTDLIRKSLGKWAFFKNWKVTILALCLELDEQRNKSSTINSEAMCSALRAELEIARSKLAVAEAGNRKLWQFIHLTKRLDSPPEKGSLRDLLTR